jgi:hypothetical protein
MNFNICEKCPHSPYLIKDYYNQFSIHCINKSQHVIIHSYEFEKNQTQIIESSLQSKMFPQKIKAISNPTKHVLSKISQIVNKSCPYYAEHLIDIYNKKENDK